jgi:hypothetical protein
MPEKRRNARAQALQLLAVGLFAALRYIKTRHKIDSAADFGLTGAPNAVAFASTALKRPFLSVLSANRPVNDVA